MIPDLTDAERLTFSAVYALPGLSLSRLAAVLECSEKQMARVILRLERLRLIVSQLVRVPAEGKGRPPHAVRVCNPAPWVLA